MNRRVFPQILLMGFLAAPLALAQDLAPQDARLCAELVRILKPRYPGAAFHATSNGRLAFRYRSRLFRDPDRLGPDAGGIAVEFNRSYRPCTAQPPTWRQRREFQETSLAFPSGDGAACLETWIRLPAGKLPTELLDALGGAFARDAAAWKPGPLSGPGVAMLPGAYAYPGGEPCALDDILDCGQVFLAPDGQQCLLRWFRPDEGIGFGDIVLYRREPLGWRQICFTEHVLRPDVVQEKHRAVVTQGGQMDGRGGQPAAFAVPWAPSPWREDGPLRARLKAILGKADAQASLNEDPEGRVVGRVHPRIAGVPEAHPGDEPAESLVTPDRGGFTVSYRLLPRDRTAEIQRREGQEGPLWETRLVLPSRDGTGSVEATLATLAEDRQPALCEAVIRELKAFAASWEASLPDARFVRLRAPWSFPETLARLADLEVEGTRYVDPAGLQCVFLRRQPEEAVLYRLSEGAWRLEWTLPHVSRIELKGGQLRIRSEEDRSEEVPWGR